MVVVVGATAHDADGGTAKCLDDEGLCRCCQFPDLPVAQRLIRAGTFRRDMRPYRTEYQEAMSYYNGVEVPPEGEEPEEEEEEEEDGELVVGDEGAEQANPADAGAA